MLLRDVTFLKYLTFQSLDVEHTWWRLYHTKLDISGIWSVASETYRSVMAWRSYLRNMISSIRDIHVCDGMKKLVVHILILFGRKICSTKYIWVRPCLKNSKSAVSQPKIWQVGRQCIFYFMKDSKKTHNYVINMIKILNFALIFCVRQTFGKQKTNYF